MPRTYQSLDDKGLALNIPAFVFQQVPVDNSVCATTAGKLAPTTSPAGEPIKPPIARSEKDDTDVDASWAGSDFQLSCILPF